MRYILAVLFLIFAGVAGADQTPDGKWLYDGKKTIEQESESGAAMSPVIWTSSDTYVVSKGTETFYLSEFVSSGKFCEIYGHKWRELTTREIVYNKCCKDNAVYQCSLCKRCRQLIKKTRIEDEWEP